MKIEKELAGLKGLKEITSTSSEGLSIVVVEFLPDVRIEEALQYVRDKVDLAKADLPPSAEEPVIKEINVAEMPILIVNISGPVSPVMLKEIADRLEDEIENIPGVLNVDVLGALEPEIRLEIDPDRVAAYGLTVPELLELVPSENVNISAGGLETPGTRFNVRVPAEFVKPEEVSHLALTVRNGRTIYLTDVADCARHVQGSHELLAYGRPVDKCDPDASEKRIGENIIYCRRLQVKMILAEAGEDRARRNVTFEPSRWTRARTSEHDGRRPREQHASRG